jgi:hypothetical protein
VQETSGRSIHRGFDVSKGSGPSTFGLVRLLACRLLVIPTTSRVPVASDVDCAGGSGNGPAYASDPVRVAGVDVYGLDRNGDGVGCESK